MIFLLVLALLAPSKLVEAQGKGVACEHRSNKVLELSCPEGQLLKVNSAVYGRQSEEVCTNLGEGKMKDLNCAAEDSLKIMGDWCNGNNSCSIEAANSVFGDPCKGTVKYLLVDYECVADVQSLSVCEHNTLDLACPAGSLIDIKSGNYGRKVGGDVLCPHDKITDLNCESQDSMAKVAQLCEGRQNCSVEAENDVFGDPCVNTFKYLEVSYTCRAIYTEAAIAENGNPLLGGGPLGLGVRCQPHKGPKCGPANSDCIAYRCTCVRFWVRDGHHCVAQTSLPLAATCRTLGEPCADANSECKRYRCFCKAGTVKIGNACLHPSGY